MEKTYSWKWWTIYVTVFIFEIIVLVSISGDWDKPMFTGVFYSFLSYVIPVEMLLSFTLFAFLMFIPVGIIWLAMTFKRAYDDPFFRKFAIVGVIVYVIFLVSSAFFPTTQQRLPDIPQIETK